MVQEFISKYAQIHIIRDQQDGFRMRAACVCFRSRKEEEVLLVSSLGGSGWIIPGGKGNFLSEGRFWTTTLPHPSPNCHQSQKLEFCSYFCPKKCPSFACTFTKMSLSEGFGTLPFQTFLWTLPSDSYWFIFQNFPCTSGEIKVRVLVFRECM